jgi:hypothetical protein
MKKQNVANFLKENANNSDLEPKMMRFFEKLIKETIHGNKYDDFIVDDMYDYPTYYYKLNSGCKDENTLTLSIERENEEDRHSDSGECDCKLTFFNDLKTLSVKHFPFNTTKGIPCNTYLVPELTAFINNLNF